MFQKPNLEWVVLGRNLPDVVTADEGKLGHDVVSHLGHVAEEEKGEETHYCTESTGLESTDTSVSRSSL